MEPIIRPYQPADFDAINILWRVSREISLPDFQFRKGHFFHEDLAYFRDHVLPQNQVWVITVEENRPSAFMAIRDDFIDHLYVNPDHWHKGYGQLLLAHARKISPRRLWLYTLQINLRARSFYEKNGFTPVEFGMSPAPENEPDVKYEWLAQ